MQYRFPQHFPKQQQAHLEMCPYILDVCAATTRDVPHLLQKRHLLSSHHCNLPLKSSSSIALSLKSNTIFLCIFLKSNKHFSRSALTFLMFVRAHLEMCSSLLHAFHRRLEQPSPFQFNKASIILALYLSLWNQIAFSSGISSRATSTSRDVLWTFGCLCKHISRCAHLFFTDSHNTQAPIFISLTQGAYNSLPFLNQIPNSSVISTTARSTSRDVLFMNTSIWRLTMMYVLTFSNNFPFLHKHISGCARVLSVRDNKKSRIYDSSSLNMFSYWRNFDVV